MKKKLWKRSLTAALLASAMAMTVTACSGKDDKKTVSTNTRSEYVYQPTFLDVDMDIDGISSICMKDGRIYVYGTKWVENEKSEEGGKQYQYFISCTEDGSDLQRTELKKLKKDEYGITLILDEQKQIRLLTEQYEYNKKTNESKQTFYVHTLNEKGKITETIDLKRKKSKSEEEDYFYFNSKQVVFSDGKLYITGGSKIYSFDEKGNADETYENENGDYIDGLVQSADGKFYIFGYLGEKYGFREFDPETGNFGKVIDFGDYSIYDANARAGEGGMVYLNDRNNVYTFDLATGKLNTEFNWLNSDIDGDNILDYFPLEGGKFLAVSSSYDDSIQKQKVEFTTMNKVKSSDVKQKEIITLSSMYIDSGVKSKILEFNKKNEKYRIETKDYSNYEDATKQINLDITSGSIPDIMNAGDGVSKDQYAKKGIFTDLYPLMEKDPEIKKEDFIPSILKTMETDGKLYYMPTYFCMEGLIASKKLVGEEEGWTVDDMIKMYNDMPKDAIFMQYMTRQWFVRNIISHQMKDYVDWSTGKVTFDSEDFVKLMEFSKNFPDEENYSYDNRESMPTLVKKGKLLLNSIYAYDITEIELYSKLYKKMGGYTVLSYPNSDKNNGLAISFNGCTMAITEACANKEGAWEFIRQFLTYDYQKNSDMYGGFPTRQDAFDKKMEYAKATEAYTDDDGTEVQPIDSGYGYDGYQVKIGPISEEEEAIIRSMVDRISTYTSYDSAHQEILEIVNEEMKAFFAGDKSAKDTASVIQSRVKIYVSENS